MRTAKPKSERSKKREAEKSVLRLSRLFHAGELFTHFTFLSMCRKQYGIEAEKAEVLFAESLQKKHLVFEQNVGLYPGIPAYKVSNMDAEIVIEKI